MEPDQKPAASGPVAARRVLRCPPGYRVRLRDLVSLQATDSPQTGVAALSVPGQNRAAVRVGTDEFGGREEAAHHEEHGGQVAKSLCSTAIGRSVRRTQARGRAHDHGRPNRGSRDQDAGDDSQGKNPLEYAVYGQASWAESFDDRPYLANVRTSTPSLGIVSSLAGPATRRKGTRRCWPVYEPAGQRGRAVR